MTGTNLNLCIIGNDWNTPSGKYRHGLCTGYLKNLGPQSNSFIAAKVSAGGVNVPETHKPPFVMVALGTGISPLRAMI